MFHSGAAWADSVYTPSARVAGRRHRRLPRYGHRACWSSLQRRAQTRVGAHVVPGRIPLQCQPHATSQQHRHFRTKVSHSSHFTFGLHIIFL